MGRTKGTLICKKCRRSNPSSTARAIHGCKHCNTFFDEDDEQRVILRQGSKRLQRLSDLESEAFKY